MGDKPFPASTINRIDNNGNYCKENCAWSTAKIQAENKRNNIYVTYQNQIYTLYNICKLLNLKHSTTYYRIKSKNITAQEYFNKYIF